MGTRQRALDGPQEKKVPGLFMTTNKPGTFSRNIDDWEPVSRAHGQRFGHIQPANTLVQAGLIGDDYLVEVEAEVTLAAASQT